MVILSFLDLRTLLRRVSATCQSWKHMVRTGPWQTYCVQGPTFSAHLHQTIYPFTMFKQNLSTVTRINIDYAYKPPIKIYPYLVYLPRLTHVAAPLFLLWSNRFEPVPLARRLPKIVYVDDRCPHQIAYMPVIRSAFPTIKHAKLRVEIFNDQMEAYERDRMHHVMIFDEKGKIIPPEQRNDLKMEEPRKVDMLDKQTYIRYFESWKDVSTLELMLIIDFKTFRRVKEKTKMLLVIMEAIVELFAASLTNLMIQIKKRLTVPVLHQYLVPIPVPFWKQLAQCTRLEELTFVRLQCTYQHLEVLDRLRKCTRLVLISCLLIDPPYTYVHGPNSSCPKLSHINHLVLFNCTDRHNKKRRFIRYSELLDAFKKRSPSPDRPHPNTLELAQSDFHGMDWDNRDLGNQWFYTNQHDDYSHQTFFENWSLEVSYPKTLARNFNWHFFQLEERYVKKEEELYDKLRKERNVQSSQ